MVYKLIWKLFGKGLAKYVAESQNRKWDFGTLDYRFVDSEGKKYYAFPKELEIPHNRYSKMRTYATWLDSNLSGTKIDAISSKINAIIEEGVLRISNGKRTNLIKLSALVNELTTGKDMPLDPQIIYNLICVQLVREDEDPQLFDETIHQEKVSRCMEEIKLGNTFFLQTLEYKRFIDYSTMSPSEWITYLQESQDLHKKLNKKLMTM